MNTITAPFQTSALLAPPKAIRFMIAGAPVQIPWSTPTRWWLMSGVVILAGLLFALSVHSAVNQREEAFDTIVNASAPSIIAAQRIRTSLADYDANLDNQLLCTTGSPNWKAAVQGANARRREFTDSLLQAAANITYGDAERKPITTMLNELGNYEAIMARAQTLRKIDDQDGARTASREATQLMHRVILPAADALDAANSQQLDRTYAEQSARSLQARLWMGGAGLLYFAALAAAQWSLWHATRRRVNLGLFAATVLTGCFALYGAASSLRSTRQLKETKEDAFDSVRYLWRARAIAFDANGAETRWLYDRSQAAVYAREFAEDTAQVARPPADVSLQEIATRAAAFQGDRHPEGFRGLLAQELNNITFEAQGEGKAAAEAIRTFGDYLDVDQKVRALESAGRHAEAVALCVSYEPGGSNEAFEKFDDALGKVLGINQDAFDQLARQGISNLKTFDLLVPGFALLAASCVFAGFWPRIKEYAV